MASRSGRFKPYVAPFAVLLFAVLPLITGGSYLEIAAFFLIYLGIGEAWNILGGYCGQISLGNAAFFGVGAYVTSVALISGVGIVPSVILGAAVSALVSLSIVPAFRLKGAYYAITTLFLIIAVQAVIFEWQSSAGRSPVIYLPLTLPGLNTLFYGLVIVVALTLVVIRVIERSRVILAWNEIKADEDSAASMGINVLGMKTLAMLIMAFITAIIGGLYAMVIGFADPADIFGINWSIYPLFMAVIGGEGTFTGPIIGAVIFTVASQILVIFLGAYSLFAFGVLLILVELLSPEGILSLWERYGKKSLAR